MSGTLSHECKKLTLKIGTKYWRCCCDYLTMWLRNFGNWFAERIWKSLEVPDAEALECSNEFTVQMAFESDA
jgi:hypothetical protein